MKGNEKHVHHHNQKVHEEVLKHFSMEECKLVGTLFDANSKLLKQSVEKFGKVQREMEGVPYKTRVGSLVYAMVAMRANIAFVGKYSEPIYIEDKSTVLDAHKTHYEVFEGHFEPHSGSSIQKNCIYPTFYKENYIYIHTHTRKLPKEN